MTPDTSLESKASFFNLIRGEDWTSFHREQTPPTMFDPEGDVRKDTGRPWRAHWGSEDLKEFKCRCCRSAARSCPTL